MIRGQNVHNRSLTADNMKNYFSCLLCLMVCNSLLSATTVENLCADLNQPGYICFTDNVPGYCMINGPGWLGIALDICTNGSYCEMIDGVSDCTGNSNVCVDGQMKMHPTNCHAYYHCSSNQWVLNECPSYGRYDNFTQRCVLGSC